MPDMNQLAEFLNKFGPLGLCIILMGAGLVYLLQWLRSEQERSANEREKAHEKFSVQLEDIGERHERIISSTVDKFDKSLEKIGVRVDVLTDRVDRLDDHVRGK